jgi:hypothetical protein
MLPSFPSRTSSNQGLTSQNVDGGQDAPIEVPSHMVPMAAVKDKPIEESDCSLISVQSLREEVKNARHHGSHMSCKHSYLF